MDKVNDMMTEDELVAILREAAASEPENEPNTITTSEYVAATGISEYRARKVLAALVDKGVLLRGYIGRINGWGDKQTIKGYRYRGAS